MAQQVDASRGVAPCARDCPEAAGRQLSRGTNPIDELCRGNLCPPAKEGRCRGHLPWDMAKNRKPLEQLQKILGEYKIPFKVAVDEPKHEEADLGKRSRRS